MKQLSAQNWIYFFIITLVVACVNNGSKKQFEISGTITNGTAKTVYLEEQPPGGTQGTIVDSSVIAKDGSYKLKTAAKESLIYNLRLDKSEFPVAAVINDVPNMTLNVVLRSGSNEFTDKYDVQGSPASQQMKDFMYAFNNYLQQIYPLAVLSDSLHKQNAPDSAFEQIRRNGKLMRISSKVFHSVVLQKQIMLLFIFLNLDITREQLTREVSVLNQYRKKKN